MSATTKDEPNGSPTLNITYPKRFPRALREALERFLLANPEWAQIATDDAANFGAGLCADASRDLVNACGGCVAWLADDSAQEMAGYHLALVCPHPGYPEHATDGHAVALFGRWVVDLTARQFGAHLPFPWIWRQA